MQVKIFQNWSRINLEQDLNAFLRGLPLTDVVHVGFYPPQRNDDKGVGYPAVVQLRMDAPLKRKEKK